MKREYRIVKDLDMLNSDMDGSSSGTRTLNRLNTDGWKVKFIINSEAIAYKTSFLLERKVK